MVTYPVDMELVKELEEKSLSDPPDLLHLSTVSAWAIWAESSPWWRWR